MVSAFPTESKKGIAFEESYRFMVLASHARQSRESSNADFDGCSVVKCISLPLHLLTGASFTMLTPRCWSNLGASSPETMKTWTKSVQRIWVIKEALNSELCLLVFAPKTFQNSHPKISDLRPVRLSLSFSLSEISEISVLPWMLGCHNSGSCAFVGFYCTHCT